ncbi:MAG: hypothetical protein LBK56_00020 [Gracilibacteraceae bacterium]|jgi:hypothetical protein|nr:hypothetical protein [Gracilibacteraceae bacterium]
MGDFNITNHMVRDEIENAIKLLGIDKSEFQEVGKTAWQGIIQKAVDTFLKIPDFRYANLHWAWQYFREPRISISSLPEIYLLLTEVIDDDKVWFFAEDTFDKMWVYEAKSKVIPQILGETSHFEYYIASKKFEWIICENHHGYLIASGEKAVRKINELTKRTDIAGG